MPTLETQESVEFSQIDEELFDLKKEVSDGGKKKNVETPTRKLSEEELKSLKGLSAEKGKDKKEKIVNSPEYKTAARKISSFMSASAPDTLEIDDRELSKYHFETVNRGPNAKPHPKMVIKEIKTLRSDIEKFINSFLMKNPANVLGLQKYLNKCLYETEDHSAARGVKMIDLDGLNYFLDGTGMELEWYVDNSFNQKWKKQRIREDGMLGPQTFAAICFFGKYCRK